MDSNFVFKFHQKRKVGCCGNLSIDNQQYDANNSSKQQLLKNEMNGLANRKDVGSVWKLFFFFFFFFTRQTSINMIVQNMFLLISMHF